MYVRTTEILYERRRGDIYRKPGRCRRGQGADVTKFAPSFSLPFFLLSKEGGATLDAVAFAISDGRRRRRSFGSFGGRFEWEEEGDPRRRRPTLLQQLLVAQRRVGWGGEKRWGRGSRESSPYFSSPSLPIAEGIEGGRGDREEEEEEGVGVAADSSLRRSTKPLLPSSPLSVLAFFRESPPPPPALSNTLSPSPTDERGVRVHAQKRIARTNAGRRGNKTRLGRKRGGALCCLAASVTSRLGSCLSKVARIYRIFFLFVNSTRWTLTLMSLLLASAPSR